MDKKKTKHNKLYILGITFFSVLLNLKVFHASVLSGLTNDFTDTVYQGTIGAIYDSFWGFITGFFNGFSMDFAPGISKFMSYFGFTFDDSNTNVFISNYFTRTTYSSSYVMVDIAQIIGIIAFSLATGLFLVSFAQSAFLITDDAQESPFKCIFHFALALIGVGFAQQLVSPIISITSDIYTLMSSIKTTDGSTAIGLGDSVSGFMQHCVTAVFGSMSVGDAAKSAYDAAGGGVGGVVSGAEAAVTSAALQPSIAVVKCIGSLIMGWVVVRELLKYFTEMAERYMWSCLLYVLSPVAFATYASKKTTQVLGSYFTMLICQLFLLIVNQIFLKSSIVMMYNFSQQDGAGLASYIVVIAWLRIGQKMDEFLRDLGLSVARTGGSVLDSVISGAMAIGAVVHGASKATGTVGAPLEALGLKTGSVGMAMAGSAMQHPFRGSTAQNVRASMMERGVMPTSGITKDMARAVSNGSAIKDASISAMVNKSPEHANQMMSSLFGNGWESAAIGPNGNVNHVSLDPKTGAISGTGTLTDPTSGKKYNGSFTAALNGDGLTNPSMAITDSFGHEWQVQSTEKPSFDNIPDGSNIGDMGIGMQLAGITPEDITDLTGRGVNVSDGYGDPIPEYYDKQGNPIEDGIDENGNSIPGVTFDEDGNAHDINGAPIDARDNYGNILDPTNETGIAYADEDGNRLHHLTFDSDGNAVTPDGQAHMAFNQNAIMADPTNESGVAYFDGDGNRMHGITFDAVGNAIGDNGLPIEVYDNHGNPASASTILTSSDNVSSMSVDDGVATLYDQNGAAIGAIAPDYNGNLDFRSMNENYNMRNDADNVYHPIDYSANGTPTAYQLSSDDVFNKGNQVDSYGDPVNSVFAQQIEDRYGAVRGSVRFRPEDRQVIYTEFTNGKTYTRAYDYQVITNERINKNNAHDYFNAGKHGGAILVHKTRDNARKQ